MILRIWISMHSAFSTRSFLSGRRHRSITEVDIVIFRWYLSTYSSWFKSTNGANLPHERRLKYQPECHTSDVLLTAMNNRRGSHGHFFVHDLGLALVAKTCPHRPQAFQAFPYVNNICFVLFLDEPLAGTLSHAYKTCRGTIRGSDCVGLIWRHTLLPTVDLTLNLNT